jgi:hypothetical protein
MIVAGQLSLSEITYATVTEDGFKVKLFILDIYI